MTFKHASAMACVAFMANAVTANASTPTAERHNFILLMPETMQPANVNDEATPALARLREEGVYFSRTFAGFPDLAFAAQPNTVASRAAELVGNAPDTYATAFVDDYTPTDASIQQALERLAQKGRPFILVCRLHALDTQAFAAARPLVSANPGGEGAAGTVLLNTDRVLASLESKLKDLGVFDATNIVVAAEHGRSTVWKQSKTSYTGEMSFSGVPDGSLPPGFLAIDLLKAMLQEDGSLSLYDPMHNHERVHFWSGRYPSSGSAIIGVLPTRPHVTIEARGGYDIIYLPETLDKKELVRRGRFIAERLFVHDYVSGVFVNEQRVGRVDGALSLKYLGVTQHDELGEQPPDIVVNFVSSVVPCGHPTICAVSIADTPVQEGLDPAKGFSRAETTSFLAARGPDFRAAFSSGTPASPADMVRTIAYLLGERVSPDAKNDARELMEALRSVERTAEPKVRTRVVSSKASSAGDIVEAHLLTVNGVDYLEAAGAPGRSLGVPAREEPYHWEWSWPWKTFKISIEP